MGAPGRDRLCCATAAEVHLGEAVAELAGVNPTVLCVTETELPVVVFSEALLPTKYRVVYMHVQVGGEEWVGLGASRRKRRGKGRRVVIINVAPSSRDKSRANISLAKVRRTTRREGQGTKGVVLCVNSSRALPINKYTKYIYSSFT